MEAAREVLVVENQDDVRRVLCYLLRRYGLAVREAVETYREHWGEVGVVLLFPHRGASDSTDDFLLGLGALHVIPRPVSDYAELARRLEGVIRG